MKKALRILLGVLWCAKFLILLLIIGVPLMMFLEWKWNQDVGFLVGFPCAFILSFLGCVFIDFIEYNIEFKSFSPEKQKIHHMMCKEYGKLNVVDGTYTLSMGSGGFYHITKWWSTREYPGSSDCEIVKRGRIN